jgi:ribonuclease P protein component
MKRYGFQKRARLLRTTDYRKVYSDGRRRNLGWLVVFTLATGNSGSRVGLTVPGSFGGAVERNRVKRRLREAVRKNWSELGDGWDIILHPRPAARSLEFGEIEDTIRKFFQTCARSAGERNQR